ncbi:MAG: hypothetical protein Q8P70_00250 [bacterium]|nr:hypothetical protein [bacterium]
MIRKLIFSAIASIVLFFPMATSALNLNLQYPKFGGKSLNDIAGGADGLAVLIPWLYNALIGLSGLAAFVMLVAGGVTWMTAGVNPSAIGKAKDMIGSAILGLLLVLTSYIILQIINPDLLTPTLPLP